MKYVLVAFVSVFILFSCAKNSFDLSRCHRIPAKESREIVLQMDVAGLTGIRYIMAVESTDVDFWFVAMDLEGAGLESPTDVAVWAVKRIAPFQGPLIPVDELAIRHSAQSSTTQEVQFAPGTDGIADAVRCTRYISAQ